MDTGQMRSIARDILDGRSDSTIEEYRRITKRLDGEHWHDYATARNVSKRYGYLLRAAYRHRLADLLRESLRAADRERKAGNRDTALVHRHQAEELAKILQGKEPEYHPVGPRRSRKTSKRKSLAGLPPDWREQVIGALKEADRVPAVVLALTGCRPAEFREGVLLERDDEDLKVTILGAKVSDLTRGGQEQRVLTFDGADPLVHWLLEHPGWQDGRLVAGGDLGAWRKRFTRAAARLGFKKISPYSLRHQFSGDQKARGWNDDRLSQALGQASARTRKHYGHARQGRGSGGLKSVTATRAVRNAQTPIPGQSPAPTPEPIPTPTPVLDLDLDLDLDTGPSPE